MSLEMIKKINGYRIFMNKKIGKGAFGIQRLTDFHINPMRCKNSSQIKQYICKYLVNSDPYLKAALISQIKIMKVLKSQNIVQLFDVMQSNNNYYIIQQLCDKDLQQYLKQQPNKILSEKQSIQLLTQICNGFLTLVKQGILHRDLKPANVFISKNKVKLGDFGLAKKCGRKTESHTAVGTPLYMAIQQLKAIPYTSKCDIWAIGFIFYQMLHGRTPWIAKSKHQLISNIQTKPLQINDNLSHPTKDFLNKALGITQRKRVSWDQLFAHPIFGDYFLTQLKRNQILENKYKKIMIDLRFQINYQNIHLKKLWTNLGYDQHKLLNQIQFTNFIKSIVPNLQLSQSNYFFTKMDINKDNVISLQQIQQQFIKHSIPLTSKFQTHIPFLIKKMTTIQSQCSQSNIIDNTHQIDHQLQNKVRSCFRKLQLTLKKKNLNLYKVFAAYDRGKNGQLYITQFGKVMKRLDSTFTQNQIYLIFNLIDSNKSGTIQFQQLNSYYSKINGIPQSLNLSENHHPHHYTLQ